jgi:hypothetical protein
VGVRAMQPCRVGPWSGEALSTLPVQQTGGDGASAADAAGSRCAATARSRHATRHLLSLAPTRNTYLRSCNRLVDILRVAKVGELEHLLASGRLCTQQYIFQFDVTIGNTCGSNQQR